MATYKDIDLTFKRHPVTGDVVTRIDTRAVLQAVREIVLTTAGEWDNFRDMGAGANRLLGENADPVTLSNMKAAVYENVSAFEPRADVKKVTVQQMSQDLHSVVIRVEFYVNNIPELQVTEIPLKRIR